MNQTLTQITRGPMDQWVIDFLAKRNEIRLAVLKERLRRRFSGNQIYRVTPATLPMLLGKQCA